MTEPDDIEATGGRVLTWADGAFYVAAAGFLLPVGFVLLAEVIFSGAILAMALASTALGPVSLGLAVTALVRRSGERKTAVAAIALGGLDTVIYGWLVYLLAPGF